MTGIKTVSTIVLLIFLAYKFFQAESSFSITIGSPALLLASFLTSSVVLLLTSFRLEVSIDKITIPNTTFSSIHRINIKSQLFGLFLPNLVGLVLSRTFLLASIVTSKEMIPILSLAEKVMSMLVLMAICLIMISGISSVEIPKDFILKIQFFVIVVLPIIFIITICLFRVRLVKLFYKIIKSAFHNFSIFKQLILNIFIFFLSCLSFLMLSKFYCVQATSLDLIPLIFIILFISSLPISISGWGVREASASFIFHYFFSAADEGLAIGLTFGLINMGALISFYLFDRLCNQEQENNSH